MPYIQKNKREEVDTQLGYLIDAIVGATPSVSDLPGVLNYCITVLVKSTYRAVTGKSKLSYSDHNSAIGMLECCKLELYRRSVAPYEDEKVIENGDV